MQQCHNSARGLPADVDDSEADLRRQLVDEMKLIVETSKVPTLCSAFVLTRLDAALAALAPLAPALITQRPPLDSTTASVEHRRVTAGLLCAMVGALTELWFAAASQGSDAA